MNSVEAVIESELEPAFSKVVEDSSDSPINIVKNRIASVAVASGFAVAEDGYILHTSEAEDVEFDQEQDDFKKLKAADWAVEAVFELALGKGHCTKTVHKLYGRYSAWITD